MRIKQLVVLTLVIAVAIPVFAQTPPKPPSAAEMAKRQVRSLTTLLNLTSAQQQQATTIYINAAKAQQAMQGNDRQTHDNLKAAIRANDTAAIDQLASSIAQNTAQITAIKAKADAAFYQILTSEQQAKLSELESQHMGPLDGPGGPGGPPPVMGVH